MRFLLLMIMSANLVFANGLCVADKQDSAFGEVTKLISATNSISSELGEFIDPGPPDEFQIFDFCEQLRDEKDVFGFHTEKIFIKYLDEKILGIKSEAGDKTINDQPYRGYLKKYLHMLKCDTRVISALSMRESSSFFKHIIDIGRADYFSKFYLSRCDRSVNGPKLDVNQYEIINGKKETILDFIASTIEHRKKFAQNMSQSQDDMIKLQSDLVDYCGAKYGREL